ncbi:hypothetical protein SAMN06265171_102422 [Chryseobacterium rhizoplanae]|uniref:Uncharacterized protein n=1 Tax=Chryseobacterium rhizoplanae TaxID=1609531 RepID=A0A521C3U3_9FLAO|nr:hypothetical protein [Chryseobacterium rhizoplanae]SMO54078.1 hypothetical protein SAMN06265171_102422 [Chryseobacterium rhizoplanae]
MKKEVEKVINEILSDFYLKMDVKYTTHSSINLSLVRYFNFRLKYIDQVPRKIMISKELLESLENNKNLNILSLLHIFNRTERGLDLNPFQSKQSFNSNVHDRLFNDWGIHHLHISHKKNLENEFFNKRTGPLLFVRFTDDTAYFIDVKSHHDKDVWSTKDFIRILKNNWPQSIERFEAGFRIYPDLDDSDIGTLRKNGYLFGINVDEKSYILLGHGQATSGDNLMATRLAGNIWRWVGQNISLVQNNKTLFKFELLKQLCLNY